MAETIAGLAGGAIVFLAGSTVVRGGNAGVQRLPWFFASPLILLGMSIIFSVLFIGLLTRFYESFLHNENSYTNHRYATVLALGFAALLSFAVGLIWLSFVIADTI